ncbi:SMP-30/gluconolactonase/LRE family protein [Bordetella bronchiseptica]|uniref:SMP-30/gluconolactonase/LRE family protein n=1 Tax=Bordetella bronchiseptica TaxID=518 RepID=UPI000461E31F|nr:SMP-30/gluconolactonase/LRE family protein [Bordetella bronchiseptica]AOB25363.1 gluconolactonase [Bordetella bronchiseptica]AWP73586.1 gluconolactonase [Bordetella bronchiseptica]AZW42615.1 gluconolactonase [Bordetella bronchiseptica]KDB96503.1 SMP-30/Gluconolaconase/LRE-like region [Bordetella bronchiseptica E010]KDC01507.1 SMP-30/Gluconolaconase/LRE-like region [Bordetella bronchiseptica D993]
MFNPPSLIVPEVFCSVPERYRKRDQSAEWLRVQKRGATAHSFLEGPAFDRAGNLYVTDIPYGRVFRISPAGDFELVAEYDGEPNGLKVHRDGRIFIADHKHGIMLLDPASGAVVPYLDRPRLERFKGVNDLFFAPNGDLYFTDQGQSGLQDPSGRVYRYSAQGQLSCLMDNIPSPNGIVLAPDGGSLLIAVTRANSVWRAPLLADGGVSKVAAFLNLSGGFGPDGLALDQAGGLAVCHPGLGSVWLFDADGEPLARVRSQTGKVITNCAYGGPQRQWLYMTEADSGLVLRARMPAPGIDLLEGQP